jgi:hypothetical protein
MMKLWFIILYTIYCHHHVILLMILSYCPHWMNIQVVHHSTFELGETFLALSSISWCPCNWLKGETVDCIKGICMCNTLIQREANYQTLAPFQIITGFFLNGNYLWSLKFIKLLLQLFNLATKLSILYNDLLLTEAINVKSVHQGAHSRFSSTIFFE